MTANSLQLPDNPRKTTWTGLTLLAAIYVVAYLSWTFFHWGGETTRQVVNSIALLPLRALTVLLAWQISNQPTLTPDPDVPGDCSLLLSWPSFLATVCGPLREV